MPTFGQPFKVIFTWRLENAEQNDVLSSCLQRSVPTGPRTWPWKIRARAVHLDHPAAAGRRVEGDARARVKPVLEIRNPDEVGEE